MIDEIDNEEIKGLHTKVASPEGYYARSLPKGYLSVSQVATYIKCGEAYRRKYVLEQPSPTNSFAVQGSAFHKSAEKLHLRMIENGIMPLEEMSAEYSDYHDKHIVNVDNMEEGETAGSTKDTGLTLVKKYHQVALGGGRDDKTDTAIPGIKPLHAERVFRVNITPEESEPIPFMGVIDVEEELEICDLKTKKRAGSIADAENSMQLALYAYVTGKPITRLDQLVKPTKTLPARFVRLSTVKTKSEVMHAVDVVSEVAQDIAAGRFRRTNPENWWCHEKWCPYWKDCRGRKR